MPNEIADEMTLFDALLERLEAATEYNADDQVEPVVVLWTDEGNEFAEILPRLREKLPQFLTLGEYDPETKTGPAIWLRCMIARTLPEADWPEEETPIIYIPGFSRKQLRAVEDCPDELAPLAELQYRGELFSQVSGRDWTTYAFLVSERGGLGLDVAGTDDTKQAIQRALKKLASTPVAELRGRPLQAADFDELINPDEIRNLLMWLSDPEGARRRLDDNEWGAFTARCRDKYDFDPETDGPLVAAEKLGTRSGNWETVWHRYSEAPERYPGIPEQLRKARPTDTQTLFFDESSWPQDNERMEDELRAALNALSDMSPSDARETLRNLEKEHGKRREWVWALLGDAPLANALEGLARVAAVTATALGGATPDAVAENYVDGQWEADAAALDALAAVVSADDSAAVAKALEATYRPWLEDAAHHFHSTVQEHGYPDTPPIADVEEGTCILFADGLRFDVGEKLREALEEHEVEMNLGWFFAAMPTVTATSKPAVSPIADMLTGGDTGEEFRPVVKKDGKEVNIERLRNCLSEKGYEIIDSDDSGSPSGKGWTEFGTLDHRGHSEGWKLARRIAEEVQGLRERIAGLLDAGWQKVVVVTDHGWLLLPTELPKVKLPHYLTETRWRRCAVLKATSQSDFDTLPWHWNESVPVVSAPGIACFRKGSQFAHGGLSVQECVVPTLTIMPAQTGPTISIDEVKWLGFRCRAQVTGAEGLSLDLRTKVDDPSSSVALDGQAEGIETDGSASIVVPDDTLEGTAVSLVVVDESGRSVARRGTIVGGE